MKKAVLTLLIAALLSGCGVPLENPDFEDTPGDIFEYPGLEDTPVLASEVQADLAELRQSFPVISLGASVEGRRHLVTEDGVVWAWGYGKTTDAKGELLVNADVAMTPKRILEDVVYFTCSPRSFNIPENYMAVKKDRTLWLWGEDIGTDSYLPKPVAIMRDVAAAQTNGDVAFALKIDGTLWGWGENYYGLMGDGTRETKPRPVKILDNVLSFSLSDSHAMAVKRDGSLWGWGSRKHGKMGNGSEVHNPADIESIVGVDYGAMLWGDYELTPVMILDGVKYVAATGNATFAIKNDDSLWGWGDNGGAGIETGKEHEYVYTPYKIMDGVAMVYPDTGSAVFAVQRDDSLWSWGRSYSGIPIDKQKASAGPIKIMDNVAFVSTAGRDYIMVIQKDGSLWSWGDNWYGHLGRGTMRSVLSATHSDDLPQKIMGDVVYVTSSGTSRDYTAALKRDGSLWTWGEDALANGKNLRGGDPKSSTGTPTKLMDISEMEALSKIKPAIPPDQISGEPVTIKEFGAGIWNDYMPVMPMNGYRQSLCSCYVEVTSSYRDVRSVEISAFLTAAFTMRNILVWEESVSHDFSEGSFRYRFRPENFRLKDDEEFTMEITVTIDGETKSAAETDTVFTTW